MAWFTCVNYYCFSYVMIYAPRVKNFVLSLERFLVVVGIFFFLWKILILKKLFTLRLMGVKFTKD